MEYVTVNINGNEHQWLKNDMEFFEGLVESGHLERTQNGFQWTKMNINKLITIGKALGYYSRSNIAHYLYYTLKLKLGLFFGIYK